MAWMLEDLRKGTRKLFADNNIDYEKAARLALKDDSADLEFVYDQDDEVYYYIWDDPNDYSPSGEIYVLRNFYLGGWMIKIKRHIYYPVELYFLFTPVEIGESYD